MVIHKFKIAGSELILSSFDSHENTEISQSIFILKETFIFQEILQLDTKSYLHHKLQQCII